MGAASAASSRVRPRIRHRCASRCASLARAPRASRAASGRSVSRISSAVRGVAAADAAVGHRGEVSNAPSSAAAEPGSSSSSSAGPARPRRRRAAASVHGGVHARVQERSEVRPRGCFPVPLARGQRGAYVPGARAVQSRLVSRGGRESARGENLTRRLGARPLPERASFLARGFLSRLRYRRSAHVVALGGELLVLGVRRGRVRVRGDRLERDLVVCVISHKLVDRLVRLVRRLGVHRRARADAIAAATGNAAEAANAASAAAPTGAGANPPGPGAAPPSDAARHG